MDLSNDSSQQAATGHLHSIRQEAVPRASGDDSIASDAGSSSAVWKPRPKQQASFSPGLAHVHCVAGADPWNDELANIKTGSIDCAVEVQVVVQQTPVKAESSVQEPPKRPRGRLRCCAATLLVLGLLATGVLVPIAVTVGLKQDIPRVYRVLEPPQPSYRLIFAFQSSVLVPAAADVLPEAVARKVTSWAALPSSGVHVAGFSDAHAMQQALEHLTAARDTGSVRSLTSSNSNSSSSSSFALKYAVSDFRLVPDRQVTQVVDPMQLFDLAKQQARQLLQDQQQHQSSDYDEDEDVYLWRLEQRQTTGQQQRRQKAKKAAEAAAASTGTPRTAHGSPGQAQQVRRQLLSVVQEHQQSDTAGADAVAAGAMPSVELLSSMTGAAQHVTGMQSRECSRVQSESMAGAVASRTGGSMASSSSSGTLPSVLQRVLLQAASRAVPMRARPQLQMQQRQAQQQVQRGGSMVAWHLADGGLGVRDAWNITSGVDRLSVAVIDSGVELTSSAVGASMWTNAAEVAGDGLDNDGNGYVDDAVGWDFGGSCGDITCSFCVPGPDPTDAAGWGTHAASVIAAQPEVASGTAGIAPGVRIMPLKIADCRHGTQLWDVAAQQGGLLQAPQHSDEGPDTPAAQAAAQQLEAKAQMQQDSGPVLLGSAAVQALDYAVLNGAHIVVAGWSAGPLLDITGGCYLDPTAAAQHGLSSAAAQGGSGCVEAVQQQLFLDVLRPLQQAGVLVITSQTGSSSKADAPAAGPPLPCSLSCELDNLLCVSASSALVPPAGSKGGFVDVVSAADFFAPLINQHSSSYYAWVDSGSNSDGSNSSADDYGDDSSSTNEDVVDSDGDDTSDRSGAESSGLKLAALSCESAQGRSRWAQLSAPGTDIMAGWSWGSHAVVSGGSAAASVAAGVAALAWSKLGQTLGAEASPGALEGLGQQVKQELLQGSSISGSSSDGRGGAAALVASRAAASDSSNASFTEDAAAKVPAEPQIERSSSSSSSSNTSPSNDLGTAVPGLELDLFGALHRSSQAPGQVLLRPSVMPPGISSACRALRYTWHILNDESGDYDTNAMWYVGRRALKGAMFPLTHWEFFGATSLVEVTGYLEVAKPGSYELAASSEDRFVLWLQDWWLHMTEADTVASPGLPPDAWTARVNFTDPGLYKLRLIIYSPSKPFNLQWKLPGSSSFSSLTSVLSFGQAQPLPQQLLHSMLLPMSAQADVGMELSARAPPAPQPKPVAASSGGGKESAPAGAASGGGQTVVASSSSRATNQLGSEALPESPAADGNSSAAANVSTSGTANSFTSATSDDINSTRPGGEQPASSSNLWPEVDAHSSGAATLEPMEGEGGEEMMLADDAIGDDSGSSSSSADGGAGMYSSDSGYQLRPGYASYPDSGAGSTYQSGNDFDTFLSSVRRFFGGGWLGRRRSSRRLLLLATTTSNTAESTSSRHALSKSVTAATTSSSKHQGVKQERLKQVQRQLAAATAAAAAAGAAIRPTAAAARRLEAADGRSSSSGSSSSSSSIWGRFSLALTFVERTQYRTLMPDLTKLVFTHTGVLPGSGLSISGYLKLQKEVLGYADPEDHKGAYGMVQGWLDWQDLNPAAVATAGSTLAARSGNSSAAGAGSANGSGKKASIATEGAGVGQTIGGVATGKAGVQFELSCDACSLQVDGMTVVGSLGPVETSACITPAAVSSEASSSSSQPGQQLLQLLMLFTTNDIRRTKISVRSRPCNGLNSSPSGSAAWVPLVAAASSPPSLGVSSAAVREDSASMPFSRGMLCSVTAQLPRVAAVAAAANATDSGGSSTLQQVVFLSAERMREAITITVNATAAAEESAADAKGSVADFNSSTPVTEAQSSITVDAPAGGSGEGEARQEAAMLKMESGQNSSSNSTDESAAALEAAMEADRQRRAAQTAAAKAAALARGIRVADLVPDWVDKLPADTEYSFSCGCYWNGSWAGNVSVGVAANSGSGHARLFLAGWPVAAKSRWAFGPSDLDVRSYSTVLQRQQLALDSDSADPLVEAAHLWSLAGSSGGFSSSSSSPHSASSSSSTRRSLTQGSATDASGGVHSGPAAAALSVDKIRSLRQSRLQQLAVSRTSSSIGSSSSSVLGLQPIGSVDAVSRRQIMPMAGHHQLLVLQGDGLTARGEVVVLAPGDVSSSGSDAAGRDSSAGNTNSNSSSYAVPSSWLPGSWDAWAPSG